MNTPVLVSLLSMLLAGPATVPAEDRAKAQSLTDEGWTLWNAQRCSDAEKKFADAVRIDDTLVAAWNGLGWAQWNQAKRAEAEASFKKCLALEPAHPGATNGLGWTAYYRRDFDLAEKSWLASAPPTNWTGLAQLALLEGRWDDAAKWAGKAGEVAGGDEFNKELLAAARKKELPENLRVRIEPPIDGPATADSQKGWELFQQGKFAEALEIFQAAMEEDPKDLNPRNGLASCMVNLGDVAGAKEHFQIILDEQPKHGAAMNGMAVCLKNEGKIEEAIKMWQEMEKVYPGSAGTWGLAFAYYEQGDFEQALPYLEKLAKQAPDNEHIIEALERAREATGKK